MSGQMTTDAAQRKREAARDFLRSAVMPLIEEVLVKKFCQTMDVIAEGRERAEPPVVNESFTAEPVGEVRFEFGAPSSVYAELYSKTLPRLEPGTKLYAAPQPEEQKADVSKLVDALDITELHKLLLILRGNIGGAMWTLDDEEEELAVRTEKAMDALAAHRKQGGQQ